MHYELAVEATLRELDERRAEGARHRALPRQMRRGWRAWFREERQGKRRATLAGEASWR